MSQSRKSSAPAKPSSAKAKKRFPFWTLPVIALCLCLLAFAWVFAEEQIAEYEKFSTMRDTVAGNTFHGPVFLDGVSLAGLTMEEARALLASVREERARTFEIYLTGGGSTWRISSDEVPMEWNTEFMLQRAYMVGRNGTLEQRYAQIKSITSPIYLESSFTYNKASVRALTDEVAGRLTLPASDATVVAFDVANRSFAFSDEQAGQQVDAEALYRTVIEKLDSGQYGATITVNVVPVLPKVTRADLEKNYTRITSFTTATTNDKNRNTNIMLAANALNGTMIAAGGQISFNETTGQRTRDKGYQEAGAIENGRTVNEVGGGVCQVSTTMFNALLRANCQIVTRKPHAWPSDYVPRGEDATVDWPNLDVVLRNPGDAPLFITSWYEDRKITVEVYGLSLGDGMSIDLESVTTYQKKPTEIVYTFNPNLSVGTTQLLKKPRTGYIVDTYKIWKLNGTEVSREKLYTSEYRMINEEYEYNDGKAH